jgi:hypothetical protein
MPPIVVTVNENSDPAGIAGATLTGVTVATGFGVWLIRAIYRRWYSRVQIRPGM